MILKATIVLTREWLIHDDDSDGQIIGDIRDDPQDFFIVLNGR